MPINEYSNSKDWFISEAACRIARAFFEEDGFTINWRNHDVRDDAWMVGQHWSTMTVTGGTPIEDIRGWIDDNYDHIQAGHHIGAWWNEESLVLDVVKPIEDLKHAKREGARQNQDAIFNTKTRQLVELS